MWVEADCAVESDADKDVEVADAEVDGGLKGVDGANSAAQMACLFTGNNPLARNPLVFP